MQRAERLANVARKLRMRAQFNRVMAILKNNPNKLAEIERELVSEGLLAPIDPSDSVRVPKEAAGEQETTGMIEDAAADEDPTAAGSDESLLRYHNHQYDRNKNKFADLPLDVLLQLFGDMNSSVCNKRNMGAFVERGKRKQSIHALLEFLEYLTDVPAEDTIDKDQRTDRKVAAYLIQQYRKCGDRANGLVLPPDYDVVGYYEHTISGDTCVITERWARTKATVRVPRGGRCSNLEPMESRSHFSC